MIQFTLNLLEHMECPVIEIPEINYATALIDSGARIPVWHGLEDDIVAYGGKLKQKDVVVKGLCEADNRGSMYTLSNFRIGRMLFTGLDIVVLTDDVSPYHMILSSSVFRHTIYEIDDINHKFNVSVEDNDYIRRLVAHYDVMKDKLYVHYNC